MTTQSILEQLDIAPLTGAMGAEIRGVNLTSIDQGTVEALKLALAEYGMIFFRQQTLSPGQHENLGSQFGELDINPLVTSVPGHPAIYPFLRMPEDKGFLVGEGWHSDVTFYEKPAAISMLYCLDSPPYGGDTCFSSQVRAYESLSPGLQKTLCSLRAIHTVSKTYNAAMANDTEKDKLKDETEQQMPEPVSHPLVRRHPVNGKLALYVNSLYTSHIDGWTVEESKPLLDYLYTNAFHEWFNCRLHWERATLAMWDNRVVCHSATGDYSGFRREMNRVTVVGERPFGPVDET